MKLQKFNKVPLYVVLTVVIALLVQAWFDTMPEPCAAASAPERFSDQFPMSKEAKSLILEYKKGWRDVCEGRASNLSVLWELGGQIEIALSPISDHSFNDHTFESGTSFLKRIKFLSYVKKTLPKFVPAFEGFQTEAVSGLYFDRSTELFNQEVGRGNEEDKAFFSVFTKRSKDFLTPRWNREVASYSWCTRYGDFDWVDEFRTLDHLSDSLSSPSYKQSIGHVRNILENEFNIHDNGTYWAPQQIGYICSCGTAESILKDYEGVLEYLIQKKDSLEKAERLKKTIAKLRSGEIGLKSEIYDHCSDVQPK